MLDEPYQQIACSVTIRSCPCIVTITISRIISGMWIILVWRTRCIRTLGSFAMVIQFGPIVVFD